MTLIAPTHPLLQFSTYFLCLFLLSFKKIKTKKVLLLYFNLTLYMSYLPYKYLVRLLLIYTVIINNTKQLTTIHAINI